MYYEFEDPWDLNFISILQKAMDIICPLQITSTSSLSKVFPTSDMNLNDLKIDQCSFPQLGCWTKMKIGVFFISADFSMCKLQLSRFRWQFSPKKEIRHPVVNLFFLFSHFSRLRTFLSLKVKMTETFAQKVVLN